MITAVFDTETTGLTLPSSAPLEKQPKVIELGIALVEGGKIIGEGNWLINPGEPISAVITKITGINDAKVAASPCFREVWNGEAQYMLRNAGAVVAHNLPFDKALIDYECMRLNDAPFDGWPKIQVCSVQEFAHLFGHRPKLTDLYKHFTGKDLAQTHRALDDVKALVEALLASELLNAIELEQ